MAEVKPKLKSISSLEELEEIMEAAKGIKTIIIDFHATWCGPCKIIAPKFEGLALEHIDTVIAIKCDVDECEDVAAKHEITAMPTFVKLTYNQEKKEWESAKLLGANITELTKMFSS
ncbi:TrxT [Bugula neritina]|uniref:TrxT n=1 Tax=Bugula neritina TaxID=10212 RepID=A0A7J7JYF3_BUGNE|nr:TrxT [Bugula neritina]